MYQPDKLKQKREELGLDQQELAELIGVSKQAYFKWEKGLSKPTKVNIAKLEKVLKVPEGYLSEDEISSIYKQLTEPNQEKAITYVRDLVSSQKVISIAKSVQSTTFTRNFLQVSVPLFMATWTMTWFITMKSCHMILPLGLMEIQWNQLIKTEK
ncbi:putative transcriptional regulator [Streptococcus pyogenes]|nr:putative transcriptional regulator [Streptococcus pyogenes]